ncbi:large ribosomal subunit protein mL64 [Periplaneta americana]|uniref:large ribosomal subunit protein mL64 n=1 Tax=Periplaneta americana TaxID=6978 RepID=UPI0037E8D7C4
MASLGKCAMRIVNHHFLINTLQSEKLVIINSSVKRFDQNIRWLKTQTVDDSLIEEASANAAEDGEDESVARLEEEIQKKRNKSRLQPHHRNLLHGNLPYPEPMAWFHDTVKYKRKMYGNYGMSTGYLPGIMWPTKADLEEMKEYESVAHPDTIHELIRKAKEKRKQEEDAMKAREDDVLKKYMKLEQWKNDVKNNAAKKLAAAAAAKAKKDRLVEEVRRHFGFKIDPRDERFKELLEKKEKEERKKAKEAKRKARQELVMVKMEQLRISEDEKGTETIDDTSQKQ